MHDRSGISSGVAPDHYRVDLKLKGYSGDVVITEANAEPAWESFKHVPQDGDVKLVITERDPNWEGPI